MGLLQATNENDHGKIPLTAYLLAGFLVNEEHLSNSLTTHLHKYVSKHNNTVMGILGNNGGESFSVLYFPLLE